MNVQRPLSVLVLMAACGALGPAGCRNTGTSKSGGAAMQKPLYERLGGEAAIKKVIDKFVGDAAGDPRVDFTRGGKWQATPENVDKLKKHLVDLVGELTGGPQKYSGRSMKDVHAGMKITQDQFNALAGHLENALKSFNVGAPEISELMAKVGATAADIVGA